MLYEYVLPFIGITLFLGAIFMFGKDLGRAIDGEFEFQDQLKQHYIGENHGNSQM
jgi:hypothetical protein